MVFENQIGCVYENKITVVCMIDRNIYYKHKIEMLSKSDRPPPYSVYDRYLYINLAP